MTLDEYYKSKGVDLTYTAQTKAPVKKGEINADWIKKEKLIVLESKEDKKQQERSGEQVIKHTAVKGLDVAEETLNLGFGSKPTHAHKQEEHRGDKRDHKGGKSAKPHFSAEDFPTLWLKNWFILKILAIFMIYDICILGWWKHKEADCFIFALTIKIILKKWSFINIREARSFLENIW